MTVFDSMVRIALSAISPQGHRGRLTTFIFHRVLSEPDPLFPSQVDLEQFEKIVAWIKEWFQLISLDEAIDHLESCTLPSRAACITFDDGYADNATNALPILIQHGAPATFFIATGFLNGGRMWNDSIIEAVRRSRRPRIQIPSIGISALPIGTVDEKREAIDRLIGLIKYRDISERENLATVVGDVADVQLPEDLMMDTGQVRLLHESGMTIGAHTVDHPILSLCDAEHAKRQISDSREYLEKLTGEKINLFAYPNGKPNVDYLPEQARLVEDLGFRAAVSTAPGTSRAGDDLFQLRRFTPWERSRHRFAARLVQNTLRRN